MALRAPNLDDRDFTQLVDEAKRQIILACPGWNDLSPGDPGMTLLEVFAHLTETMIYRLNRLPEKAYVEFLRLIGVQLQPPSAAQTTLRFTLPAPAAREIEIPRGTKVSVSRASGSEEAPVFVTSKAVTIAPGKTSGEVSACHLDFVEAEHADKGTGLAGQSVRARRPPLVAPLGNELDLVVAVEASPEELTGRVAALKHGSKDYRIWREVDNFTDCSPEDCVFIVDRITGTITFPPSLRRAGPDGRLEDVARPLAQVPAAGREILLWYGRARESAGDVPAGALDTMKDAIAGVRLSVTNPQPATGSRPAETLENALLRGPLELHSLKRAVTARDYEGVALATSGAIERAKAFTQSDVWRHAAPGTVEVLLVPKVPPEEMPDGFIGVSALKARQTEEARLRIQKALDERKTIAIETAVSWAHLKEARVRATVVVHREEDPRAVEQRVRRRLHETLSPLTSGARGKGWRFGQTLRDSHIYDIVLAEPGVSYAEDVDFFVDDVPVEKVSAVASDFLQPRTWYTASGETLYRTLNNGEGWEPAGRFPAETIRAVVAHPWRAGMIAVATRVEGEKSVSRIHASNDCGETWQRLRELSFTVEDLAWGLREQVPLLFLATDVGLYEMFVRPGRDSSPVQVVVDKANQTMGFYAVTAAIDANQNLNVIAAAQEQNGVFLSSQGGISESFRPLGLKDEDVRVLVTQTDGPRSYVWAGMYASGPNDPGSGCFRWELLGSKDPIEKWIAYSKGWKGGSCFGMAVQGSRVLAATHHSGVLAVDSASGEPAWVAPDFVKSGLPLRDEARFHPVDTIAAAPEGTIVLAGGLEGVFRSMDRGGKYAKCSDRRVESVTLPETWLFCSGAHEIKVVREDEKTGH